MILGLIPARAGSKGVHKKNIKLLAGYPLIAYSIIASKLSSKINRTIVSTDSLEFSEIARYYGAEVPSVHITPCCGAPGYMPKFIAYLTEHIGIQIIPLNLVLQITVSYLVAVNTALAVNAISISKKTGGLGGIGATTGLFIACPTCVGSFLSLFVGATSAIAFTIAVSELQTLFITITIPILLLTPFIFARRISNATNDKCEIN